MITGLSSSLRGSAGHATCASQSFDNASPPARESAQVSVAISGAYAQRSAVAASLESQAALCPWALLRRLLLTLCVQIPKQPLDLRILSDLATTFVECPQ